MPVPGASRSRRWLLVCAVALGSVLLQLPPSQGASAPAHAAPLGATYDLYASYPNLTRLGRGYFLRGTNKYHAPNPTSRSNRTSLWFEPQPDGTFKQFAGAPYGECHWDLLRWGAGKGGVLVYLATEADCYSDHTGIEFRPGIAFMPRTWSPGQAWEDAGVSQTVYSENEVPVCAGTNTWQSRVLGLVRLPDGQKAVHTQTNETQTLAPIAGAASSSACPSGGETQFDWQENYFLDASIAVRSVDGSVVGTDVGLARSMGGNPATTLAAGHPQWDSIFTKWLPLPPREVGTLTTSTTTVANASAGNTIAFTYTAPPTGLVRGMLRITAPVGWTAPVTTNAPGCTASSGGKVSTSGQTITVSGLTLPANGRTVVRYGATVGGACAPGDGAAASSTPGAPVWRASVRSNPGDLFTNFPATPSINVEAADGAGTLVIAPTSLAAGSTANTLRFVFFAPTGGTTNGALSVSVPPGWTPPVTAGASGCTTASTGTITTSGQTITVSGLTLAANSVAVITYGATSGGNCSGSEGAAAPPTPGTSTFTAKEMSTPGGTPTALGAAPTVSVG
jgi:hypothetical protein